MPRPDASAPSPRKFGTFGGVFTPCTLTILGVIMFLRFGQVVGQAGILHALLIVLVAKAITTLTTLSLSAIATNTRVKGGGAYYLISRSLGVEFGGAIGIVFFLAQAVSVAMYVIGFTEALVATLPSLREDFVTVAGVVNLATFLCVYIGAGWTLKVQYVILAALGAALVSFYVGAIGRFDAALLQQNLHPTYSGGENMLTMFALFFPAVTGIMAGANMSGDLAAPSRSIPRGTLLAVGVTALVYLSQAFLLGCVAPSDVLIGDTMVIGRVSAWPVLITAGVFAATLSSALGSMMGAPRILQAFARDEVFPSLKFFAAGSGRAHEPRRATVLTFAISAVCILLGDLDAIAPIITMFFMITYGLLNLATFYEAVTHNPSYRPTFRYSHWATALAGALGCGIVMFLVNWTWALASIVFIAALHAFIRSREIEARWGNLQSGVVFERARQSLLRLEDEASHPKNWRPVLMALSGTGWTRPHIPIYGYWLTSGHGILTLAHVVQGDLEAHAERRERYETLLRRFIAREGLRAFPAVAVHPQRADGIEALIQCHGIGSLKPNTILMGWPRDGEPAVEFGGHIRRIAAMGRSVLAARFLAHREEGDETEEATPVEEHWAVPDGPIDVWWRGLKNGALMLLLAHLLHTNPDWRAHRIRLRRVVDSEDAVADVERHLAEVAVAARIRADVDAPVAAGRPIGAVIQEASRDASVVFLGFQTPAEGDERALYERMESLAGDLPRVFFVESAGGVALES